MPSSKETILLTFQYQHLFDHARGQGRHVNRKWIGLQPTRRLNRGCTHGVRQRLAHHPNNANVLCLGSDLLTSEMMAEMARIWLETEFESGGRHERRVKKILDAES